MDDVVQLSHSREIQYTSLTSFGLRATLFNFSRVRESKRETERESRERQREKVGERKRERERKKERESERERQGEKGREWERMERERGRGRERSARLLGRDLELAVSGCMAEIQRLGCAWHGRDGETDLHD